MNQHSELEKIKSALTSQAAHNAAMHIVLERLLCAVSEDEKPNMLKYLKREMSGIKKQAESIVHESDDLAEVVFLVDYYHLQVAFLDELIPLLMPPKESIAHRSKLARAHHRKQNALNRAAKSSPDGEPMA
jgi:hypothetical protein